MGGTEIRFALTSNTFILTPFFKVRASLLSDIDYCVKFFSVL